MAYLSIASYCESTNLENWNCGTPCENSNFNLQNIQVIYNSSTQTQLYIGYDASKDLIVLSFRGTIETSFINWLENSKLAQVPYPYCENCQVHDGFL